jgi:antitoxin component YwqK of YwqJK toxin-antitoxin module
MEGSRKSSKIIWVVGSLSLLLVAFLAVFWLACSSNDNIFKHDFTEELELSYSSDSSTVTSCGFTSLKGKQGEWMYFDSNGILTKIEHYENGVLDGQVVEFLCCQKFSTYAYKNGSLEGQITYYSSEGYISSKGNFRNGKLHGIWIDFIEGEILSISNYVEGMETVVYENPKHKNAKIGKEFFGCCVKE